MDIPYIYHHQSSGDISFSDWRIFFSPQDVGLAIELQIPLRSSRPHGQIAGGSARWCLQGVLSAMKSWIIENHEAQEPRMNGLYPDVA